MTADAGLTVTGPVEHHVSTRSVCVRCRARVFTFAPVADTATGAPLGAVCRTCADVLTHDG